MTISISERTRNKARYPGCKPVGKRKRKLKGLNIALECLDSLLAFALGQRPIKPLQDFCAVVNTRKILQLSVEIFHVALAVRNY
jgi:hypothetical protein